ncbi:MAG: beta-N-acetylhexosaminidase [Acidobacteriota bacterium]
MAALLALALVPIAIIPRPERIEPQQGTWTLTAGARIVAAGPAATAEGNTLADALAPALGHRPSVLAGAPRPGDIALTLAPSRTDLGTEGYELEVRTGGVRMTAAHAAGLFYAGQTLRQLLPVAAFRRAPAAGVALTAPCVRITDRPRFGWRGLLLDPARHFIPKSAVLEIIDVMAMHKLNRLQLHLTDDQGWRLELRAFPKLTARSSWRDGTLIGRYGVGPERYSKVPNGGFYSRGDLREIVAYAAARHIVVVPEIEMPGHARAWISAYPEFGVFPEKAAGMDLMNTWGVSKDVLAPRPATLDGIRKLLDEVCEIFPSPWIHTGGDEAPRDQWRESPEMQELIRKLGLKNEDELQAWFTGELSRYLESKGRRLVGWDEILAGAQLGASGGSTALAQSAIVMSWRGEKGGIAASQAGHDVIMAPNDWTYIDYMQGPPAEEPLGIGGSVPLLRTMSYDPVPAGLPAEAARRILGAQMQLWSEYMPNSDHVEYMAFPRACALAENFWSPREGRDLNDFLRRIERQDERLQAIGVARRPLARRTSWPEPSGRVVLGTRDAVIHGTDIVRLEDGSLAGWKDPFTMIAWRAELPAAGTYRVRIAGSGQSRLVCNVAGQAVRDGYTFRISEPGARVLFLRAEGEPGPDGFAVIQGVELVPEQ